MFVFQKNYTNCILKKEVIEIEEQREIKKGLYQHFKGKFYRVFGICTHTETKEKFIYYQALYGKQEYYIKPYNIFAAEVDKIKYPLVEQKYKFEFISSVQNEIDPSRNVENTLKRYYKERGISMYYKVLKYLGNNEALVKRADNFNYVDYVVLSKLDDLIFKNFIEDMTEEEIAMECPKLLFDY